jgi:hypothetical protein
MLFALIQPEKTEKRGITLYGESSPPVEASAAVSNFYGSSLTLGAGRFIGKRGCHTPPQTCLRLQVEFFTNP